MNRKAAAALLAIAIAAPAEGIRQYAYRDPPGILTVCAGHTGSDVVIGKKYSLKECRSLLTNDMNIAVDQVDKCVPGLPENVLAAFADATFNSGTKIACDEKRSTAARLLKVGRIKEACLQLPRWNKSKIAGTYVELPGLTARREKEKELCLQGL